MLEEQRSHVDTAIRLWHSGHAQQALGILLPLLAEGQSKAVESLTGFIYYDTGRFEEAIPHLEAALALSSRLALVARALFHCFYRLGRKAAALEAARTLASITGSDDDRQIIVDLLKESVETVEDVLALIEERPGDAELFQLLGLRYLKAGQLKEAREAYERSLALDPSDPWTHLYMGNWFYHVGKLREALKRFKRAAELLPDVAIVYTCQGDIYREQGRHDLAEAAYKTAVHVAPDDPEAKRKLSEWYEFLYGERRG